jgi:tetratricopeptide (TPR) repeat protein
MPASILATLAAVSFLISIGATTPARSMTMDKWDECHAKADIAACTHIIEDPASNRCERAVGYSERAMLRRHLGDIDGALADANEAIRLDDTVIKRWVRAKVWLDQDDYDRALADLDEAIRTDRGGISYFDRGVVLFAKGDFAAAIQDFTRVRPYLYGAPWLFVARGRAGADNTSDLAADELSQREIQFLLGHRSAEDLIASAGHDGERCRAWLFIGERDLLRGRNADAAVSLKQATSETCRAWDAGFTGPGKAFVAAEELKRLGR